MRSVRDLLSAAGHTIRDARAAVPKREPISLGKEGAAAAGVQVAEIVAIDATTFSCKWHDENGDVTGDPFTVYAFSLPAVGGLIGQQLLADCDPQRIVGDLVRIEQRNQYIGNGTYQAGWWAVPEFTLFGGECPCT